MDTLENEEIEINEEIQDIQDYEDLISTISQYDEDIIIKLDNIVENQDNEEIINRLDVIIENQQIADNHNLINTPLLVIVTFTFLIALVVRFIKNLF